jgi:hypothetical protein
LEQATLQRRRASESRQRRGDDIISLFQAAGFGIGGTRGELDALGRRAEVRVYRWQLVDGE